MIKDLLKAKDRVHWILENFPDTRDSDKLLWLAYLVIFHGLKDKIGTDNYLRLRTIIMDTETCTMESITRCRRKIQESGLFEGENRAQRLEEQEQVRDNIRYL